MATGRARPAPALRVHAGALQVTDAALLDGLVAIAGAGSRIDVAAAICAVLVDLDGVRAVAVTQRADRDAIVLGSAGYGCDAMAPGARLPLDSGLPVAEAIRTGRTIRQGEGPGWLAVPFGRRTTAPGALLLSLTVAPPADEGTLARLQRLTTAVGDALVRAERADRAAADLATVVAGLGWHRRDDERDVAVRQSARGDALGGDVALALPDGRGGRWLVAADVCGSGLPAATGAAAVRTALRALAPLATGPADLLLLLDGALRPEAPDGGFVTAVAVHVAGGRLRAASAGHPAPLLLQGGTGLPLAVQPGPPLALETSDGLPGLPEIATDVPEGSLLVLYTDGLTDRRGPAGSELDVSVLLGAATASEPAAVADALVAVADAAGTAVDDTSVLVSRL